VQQKRRKPTQAYKEGGRKRERKRKEEKKRNTSILKSLLSYAVREYE
jgi:hypothetical protein